MDPCPPLAPQQSSNFQSEAKVQASTNVGGQALPGLDLWLGTDYLLCTLQLEYEGGLKF